MRRLPSKILKEPWIDTSVEIRFIPSVDRGMVFESVYSVLQDTYPNKEELTLLRIPEDVRRNDSRFFNKPEYRITGECFNVQIGPDTLSVHCNNSSYVGWGAYSQEIKRVIRAIENLNVIEDVTQLGIRYINFIPYNINIFRDLELSISNSGRVTTELPTSVRFTIREESNFLSTLQIANFIEAVQEDGTPAMGSIIDIDTHRQEDLDNFFKYADNLIDQAHTLEKTLFFSLFSEDYLESLNPIYDDKPTN